MLWIVLSLLTAFAVATQDFWIKKQFAHLSPYDMVIFPAIYSLPGLALTILYISIPPVDDIFYITFLVSIPLNGICLVLYMYAIKHSPLSLTIPFLAFTPVFMIGTGYLFLEETVNHWGILGIFLICAGSYTLNIEPGKWRFMAPLTAIFNERGSWVMLLVAFLFSFAASIGKLAILHSSPLFFSIAFFLVLNITLIVIFVLLKKIDLSTYLQSPVKGIIAGLLFYCHIVLHGFAVSLTKVAYMISIKRLSILFGIIYGGVFLDESNIRMRMVGASVMFMGTLCITILG